MKKLQKNNLTMKEQKNEGHSKSSFSKRIRGYNEYQRNYIVKEPTKMN